MGFKHSSRPNCFISISPFPLFKGFSDTHHPYESGGTERNHGLIRDNSLNQIPLEYYLAGRIFPFTFESQQNFLQREVAERMTPQSVDFPSMFGKVQKRVKGEMTPEEALGRELTTEEKKFYAKINPGHDVERERVTPEMDLNKEGQDPWKDLDVYERFDE